MENYKEMYLTLFHATEKAIRELISAQQACEELYIELTEKEKSETAKIIPLGEE